VASAAEPVRLLAFYERLAVASFAFRLLSSLDRAETRERPAHYLPASAVITS
jgi:hypothetical protein